MNKNIELLKTILTSENVVDEIRNNLDFILKLIPELKYEIGFDHKHPHHHLDVWEHTLLALSISINDFDVRLALLLHDIGKPFSFQEGDVRHFKNHAVVSSIMSNDILKRIGFKNYYIDIICLLIRYHDTDMEKLTLLLNSKMLFKLFNIQRADALAHNPDKLEKRIKYLKRIKDNILNKNI